jgi:hypothetical protein
MLQIIGFLTGIKAIRGLGAVSAASPLPIVFTEVRGVETFALDMSIRYTDDKGKVNKLVISPQVYSKMGGAYNWRNVYGAAFSYGPVLPKKIWYSILYHGFFEDTILHKRFGIPTNVVRVDVILVSKTKGRTRRWLLRLERNRPPAFRRKP